jgi:uncharacterized membrane protein
MQLLILGLVVFLGSHSVSIVAPGWRDRMVATLGERGWKIAYAAVAIVGFLLIIKGYGAARLTPTILYQPPIWIRHVTVLLMLPVFPLLLAAYLPGRISNATKHPMLVTVKLWAFAHLLANGSVADVLLFGGFLAWAVADRISLKRRPPRPVRGAPPGKLNDVIAVAGGLALYAFFLLWAHQAWIGVAPIAGL